MHINCIKYQFLYLQSIAHTYSKIIAHSTNIYPTTSISRKLFSIVFNAYKSQRNVKLKWFGSVCDITWSFLTLYLLLVKSLASLVNWCVSFNLQTIGIFQAVHETKLLYLPNVLFTELWEYSILFYHLLQ